MKWLQNRNHVKHTLQRLSKSTKTLSSAFVWSLGIRSIDMTQPPETLKHYSLTVV